MKRGLVMLVLVVLISFSSMKIVLAFCDYVNDPVVVYCVKDEFANLEPGQINLGQPHPCSQSGNSEVSKWATQYPDCKAIENAWTGQEGTGCSKTQCDWIDLEGKGVYRPGESACDYCGEALEKVQPRDCSGNVKFGGRKCPCEPGTYSLGRYEVDTQGGFWGTNNFKLDIKFTLSKKPEENGKVLITGNVGFSGLGKMAKGKIKDHQWDFFGKFILVGEEKSYDLMYIILYRLLDNGGDVEDSLGISSKSIDKTNKRFNILVQGTLRQTHYIGKPDKEVYDEVLGPFKREQVKNVLSLLTTAIHNFIDPVINGAKYTDKDGKTKESKLWDTPVRKVEAGRWYTYYHGQRAIPKEAVNVDGKWNPSEYEEREVEIRVYDDGEIQYHDMSGDGRKFIQYVPPKENVDYLLECAKKYDSIKTPTSQAATAASQSVWMMRDNLTYEGKAYHFFPSYNFIEAVNLTFSDLDGEPLHYDESILDYCNYSIIMSANRTVDDAGGEINIPGEVRQFFPEGSVLDNANFTVEVINISSCNHCLSNEMDIDETGVDCGGSCGPCDLNCWNGIKDQDEEGVDCGGSCVNDFNETGFCGADLNKDCNITLCPDSLGGSLEGWKSGILDLGELIRRIKYGLSNLF
jgi:hypothetical protein